MKKYFLTAAALLLLSPLTASADIVGTGVLDLSWGSYDTEVMFGSTKFKTSSDYEAVLTDFDPAEGYTALTLSTKEVYSSEKRVKTPAF